MFEYQVKENEIKELLSKHSFLSVKTIARYVSLRRAQVSYILYNNIQFSHIKRAPFSRNKKIIWSLA